MNQGVKKTMREALMVDNPRVIAHAVYKKIDLYEGRKRRNKGIIFSSLSILLIAAFVPMVQYLFASASQTGFSHFMSLVFTDSSYVFSDWRSYGLSLLETLPIANSVFTLLVLSALIYCGYNCFAHVMTNRKMHRHRFNLLSI